MKKVSLYLTISLIIVSSIVGVAVGYYFTPQYAQGIYDKSMELGQADGLVDLRYINAMITHHRGALLLAEQAQKSKRLEIQRLVTDIQKGEPKLIEELYQWKKDWYGDTKKVRDPLVSQLGEYDLSFDLRFLNALIAHHQAGMHMTEEIRGKSSRTEIVNNADGVENFLSDGIEKLKGWRSAWYKVN